MRSAMPTAALLAGSHATHKQSTHCNALEDASDENHGDALQAVAAVRGSMGLSRTWTDQLGIKN